ncbi:probable G-protein coupled receptor No18 [Patiria miniata]|uniref:G-protein coupled receptors family 1 profile domain-containing protein n=1 Tax=Patiria miniata TaxID=46514 RepID=A0A914ATP2_PATMI|nr:probable G-protein coupled receptor No18 [Patiria miniata]
MADTNSSLNFVGDSLFTYEERVVVAVLVLIIFVCGTVGNSIVILAVILSQDLQNITNVFVVSLATADLCYCLLLPISNVVALLSIDGWPWESEALCSLSALMSFTCAGASLYNLACIALNRMLLVRGPVTVYQWLFTPRKIVCLVMCTWAIPLAVLLIPLSFGIGELGYDQGDSTCSDIDSHPRYVEYHLIQAFCLYPIPLLTIVISYSLIFLHVKRHFERREESFRESHEMVSLEGEPDDNTRQLEARFKKRVSRQQLKITMNLFMVTCAFVLFSAPYSLALLSPHNSRVLLFLSVPFTCNSCVNPIIYTVNHPRFNGVIRCILRCRFGDIPRPSYLLVSARARLRPM